MASYDVVIMTDLRFPGGSSKSTLEEIRIQHSMGLRTGLVHRPCSTLAKERPFHRDITEAILDGKADLINFESKVQTNLLVVRHPGVIHPPLVDLPDIDVSHVVVIINHPPVNAKGRVDYILPFVKRALIKRYSCTPLLFPIGPLVRTAIEECYDGTVRLQPKDWSNVFDVSRFEPLADRKPPAARKLRIGRHSRPGREKWPSSAEAIRAAYLVDSNYDVVVLGGAQVPSSILGFTPSNWTVHPFGSLDILEFLSCIDVFVYYHHPDWIEAFGRVIAEAMASGLPTILPHHFRSVFGDGALYASPEEVECVVRDLHHPEIYRRASERAVSFVRRNFSPDVHVRRVLQFQVGHPMGARTVA